MNYLEKTSYVKKFPYKLTVQKNDLLIQYNLLKYRKKTSEYDHRILKIL